ncbi:hypothetical protein Hdeb2414_s0025g00660901 [Helianthus debilis subsp. tardiflorus]
MKRNGDNGSPCRRPRLRANSFVGEPLTRTDALLEDKQALIHLLHLLGKPIIFMLSRRNPQFTESYALSKSTLKSITSNFFFFAHETTSFTISGPSKIFLFSTKAD